LAKIGVYRPAKTGFEPMTPRKRNWILEAAGSVAARLVKLSLRQQPERTKTGVGARVAGVRWNGRHQF